MGKGRNRKPKQSQIPNPQKRPTHTKDPEGFQHQFIGWHFQCLDDGGDWRCDCNIINDLMPLLCEYENMTWVDVAGRPHTHPMPVDKICKQAQNRLDKIGYDDGALLYQLSAGGKRRLWGFRQQNILQILWWDPDHSVYPMKW